MTHCVVCVCASQELDLVEKGKVRVKGILNVAGEAGPLVVHGVHDTFHPPTLLPAWPDEDRRSRLVFILRDLKPVELQAAWEMLLADLP